VHFDNTSRAEDEVRYPWQRLVKIKFLNLAMKLFHTVITRPGKESDKQWAVYYDRHINVLDRSLILGHENDVPTSF
jgi:hypothetical protein